MLKVFFLKKLLLMKYHARGKNLTMFGSQSLQCVTCQKMVEEFEWAINKVDPKKKIESGLWDPLSEKDPLSKKKKIVSN